MKTKRVEELKFGEFFKTKSGTEFIFLRAEKKYCDCISVEKESLYCISKGAKVTTFKDKKCERVVRLNSRNKKMKALNSIRKKGKKGDYLTFRIPRYFSIETRIIFSIDFVIDKENLYKGRW